MSDKICTITFERISDGEVVISRDDENSLPFIFRTGDKMDVKKDGKFVTHRLLTNRNDISDDLKNLSNSLQFINDQLNHLSNADKESLEFLKEDEEITDEKLEGIRLCADIIGDIFNYSKPVLNNGS